MEFKFETSCTSEVVDFAPKTKVTQHQTSCLVSYKPLACWYVWQTWFLKNEYHKHNLKSPSFSLQRGRRAKERSETWQSSSVQDNDWLIFLVHWGEWREADGVQIKNNDQQLALATFCRPYECFTVLKVLGVMLSYSWPTMCLYNNT